MTKSAVKSRANSIPSHHHILAATQLGELNALLSAEAENKGKFPGSPAKPGPAEPHESVKFGPAYATSLSCHRNFFILPPSNGTLCLPERNTRNQKPALGSVNMSHCRYLP